MTPDPVCPPLCATAAPAISVMPATSAVTPARLRRRRRARRAAWARCARERRRASSHGPGDARSVVGTAEPRLWSHAYGVSCRARAKTCAMPHSGGNSPPAVDRLRRPWVPRSPPVGGGDSAWVSWKRGSLSRPRTEARRQRSLLAVDSGRQVGREVAQARLPGAAERVLERLPVRLEALARVVAGGAVRDQERPVGALQGEQLAQRPLCGRSGRGERPQLRRALAPGEAAGGRGAPRAQVAPGAPARRRQVRRRIAVVDDPVEEDQVDA